jgi:leucine dehydrogenase
MSVFSCPDYDDHEQVSFFRDAASGLRAIVALHSTAPYGIAGGGCRMWPYASDDEALRDALRLSRAMSYKLALCDMPAGGAKCVIIGDPRKDKSERLLMALGRAVDRMGGHYIIAEDVGTTESDMRIIGTQTKFVVGKHTDTGPATAYGTFLGLGVAVERALGRKDLTGIKVAVQGLGNVGARLCHHLSSAGAQLVVTDVDPRAVERVVEATRARTVSPEKIYDEEVDVFAPCALGAILDDATIPRLRCKVVAGAANNQLAEERHAAALAQRGILFAPDFVLNAGGVIGASQEGMTLGEPTDRPVYDEALAFKETRLVAEILRAVFARADRDGKTPFESAVEVAKEKIKARQAP